MPDTAEQTGSTALHEIDWEAQPDDQIRQFVKQRYTDGKQRRNRWEMMAAERLAWAAGDQMIRVDGKVGQDGLPTLREAINLENIPLEHRLPITVNRIKSIVLTLMAGILEQPITWAASPPTGEDDDIAAAKACDRLLRYAWKSGLTSLESQMPEILWMLYVTGPVWLYVTWDPWLREPGEDKAHGGHCIKLCNGFDITEPPDCKSVRHADWLIVSEWITVERLRARYPNAKTKEVQPMQRETLWDWTWLYQQSDDNLTGGAQVNDQTLIHHLWRPWTQEVPKGVYACVAESGGEVLKSGPNPYRHGRIPVAELYQLPEPRMRKRCTTHDIMGLQATRNRTRSQIDAHVAMQIDPKIAVDDDLKLNGEAFTTGPKVIPIPAAAVRGVEGIKPIEYPQIPRDAWALDDRTRQDMDDVAMVHDASRGRREPGVESGRHAALLQQADMRGHATTRRGIQDGLADAGRLVLHLYHQYVDSNRMLTITGERMANEVFSFKGSDLFADKKGRPGPVGPFEFNVQVRLGREVDQQATLEKIKALQEGMWLNPAKLQDRLTVFRMLGEDQVNQMDDGQIHRSNAQEENRRLAAGGKADDMSPAEGDDDDIHEWEHRQYTVSPEYRDAVRKDKNVATEMLMHIQATMVSKAMKAGRILQAQQLAAQRLVAEAKILGLDVPMPGGGGQQGSGPMAPPAPAAGPPVSSPMPAAAGNGRMAMMGA